MIAEGGYGALAKEEGSCMSCFKKREATSLYDSWFFVVLLRRLLVRGRFIRQRIFD